VRASAPTLAMRASVSPRRPSSLIVWLCVMP
jgi:hypothetical protein